MPQIPTDPSDGRKLLQMGILLFLLGLLTGFAVPATANPRMALSSHLEGLMNGTFLVLLGLIWPRLELGRRSRAGAAGLAYYGTFTNWGTTLLAAFWGAGEGMMPIAGAGHQGSAIQEGLIAFGLLSLSLSMLLVCGFVLWGLRARTGPAAAESDGRVAPAAG